MKTVLIIIGILVLIAGGVAFYLASNLDRIVAEVIEREGTAALGVPVTVGSVELSLTDRTGAINDLRVANPPGYSNQPAMSLSRIALTIGDSPTHVKLIDVVAPGTRVEEKGGTTNIDTLAKKLERTSAAPETAEESEATEPVEISIDRIQVEAAEAKLISETAGEERDLRIDEFAVSNLSGTPDVIAQQILDQVLERVQAAAVDALKDRAMEELRDRADEEIDKLKSRLFN